MDFCYEALSSMPPSLLETFRVLSAFSPARRSLQGAPWDAFVDWAISNGLAPLAAHNLEYRLAGGDAPEWARDRLLAVYQGTANDNVMKLVNFKRAVDRLEDRKIVITGGAAFAESLYAHIAFRPVIEICLLIADSDVDSFASFLSRSHFKPFVPRDGLSQGFSRSLTDGRTPIHIFDARCTPGLETEASGLFRRAEAVKAYGPSVYRLAAEDELLVVSLEHARAGYDVPYISFVDFRELLLRANTRENPSSEQCVASDIRERARALDLNRALYASCRIAALLFPEVADVAASLQPRLPLLMRTSVEIAIVQPLCRPGRNRASPSATALRRRLTRPREV